MEDKNLDTERVENEKLILGYCEDGGSESKEAESFNLAEAF